MATDALYGRLVYPWIGRALASVSGLLPFSLSDITSAVVVLSLVGAAPTFTKRMRRSLAPWPRSLAAGLLGFAARAALVWTAFVVLWGFNYARPFPATAFGLAPPISKEAAQPLVARIGERLDAVRRAVREDDAGVVAGTESDRNLDDDLRAIQAEALREAGLPPVDAGRVKRPLTSPLLLRWRVAGFYGPFTGEPNVVRPTPPGDLPFTIAHERAHLSGFASEDAASFVAFLTCWRSARPEVRYSAWLALWLYVDGKPKDRSDGVKRDLAAIAEFRRAHPPGREIGLIWRGYSRFLQAHGVAGGTASYGRAANLALRWLDRHGLPAEPSPASHATSISTFSILIGSDVLPLSDPTASSFLSVSNPSTVLPKMLCFPSSQGVGTKVKKNWLPSVFGPALAIERSPGVLCFTDGENSPPYW